jgi:multicomponent Na+:H+ antiporter subunit C
VEEVSNDPEDTRVSQQSGTEDEAEDIPQPTAALDTDAPDELDALPGFEGAK